MGREYIFYPAFRRKEDDKIVPLLFDTKGEPESIFWRSGSFIDGDFFIKNFPMINKDEFGEGFAEKWEDVFNDIRTNDMTYIYEITEPELCRIGESCGLVSGYAPLDDIEMYYKSDYPQEYYYWQMEKPIPAELYAEMPKSKQDEYGKFATIDTYSSEYICGILAEVLNDIIVPWDWEGYKTMVMLYSF